MTTKDLLMPKLLAVFRQYGYEGASLSRIAEATGLGKASLYHHFPQGKAQMVQDVMLFMQAWRQRYILEPLTASEAPPLTRLQGMVHALIVAYDEGRALCMLSILTISESRQEFLPQVQPVFISLIQAIAAVLMQAGLPPELAQERAEDAVIDIQGALILSHGLQSNQPFLRIMNTLPEKLLASSETLGSDQIPG